MYGVNTKVICDIIEEYILIEDTTIGVAVHDWLDLLRPTRIIRGGWSTLSIQYKPIIQ